MKKEIRLDYDFRLCLVKSLLLCSIWTYWDGKKGVGQSELSTYIDQRGDVWLDYQSHCWSFISDGRADCINCHVLCLLRWQFNMSCDVYRVLYRQQKEWRCGNYKGKGLYFYYNGTLWIIFKFVGSLALKMRWLNVMLLLFQAIGWKVTNYIYFCCSN